MIRQRDQEHLYNVVQQLETNIRQIKRLLKNQDGNGRTRKTKVRQSLYGIFPTTNVSMKDFRDARRSWSRRLGSF